MSRKRSILWLSLTVNFLINCQAPELNTNVFRTALSGSLYFIFSKWDCQTIKLRSWLNSRHAKDGRCEIGVACHGITDYTFGNSWSTNKKRDINIFLKPALLSRWKAMLADVESVVTSVDDVGVIHDVERLELFDNLVNHFINSLQRLQTKAKEIIAVVNISLVQSRALCYPIDTTRLVLMSALMNSGIVDSISYIFWVEVGRPGDF